MPAKLDLVLPGSAPRPLPSKVPHMNIGKDGSFICYGPAGGGYYNDLPDANSADTRAAAGLALVLGG